jgi:hypothetical protein
MRDRLIELLRSIPNMEPQIRGRQNGKTAYIAAHIAEHLLANGVIVPPCKVGQTVYKVHYPLKSICEYTVKAIYFTEDKKYYPKPHIIVHHEFSRGRLRLNFTEIGKTVFLTREEAEKALAERSGE